MRILLLNDHARNTGGADIYCFELDRMLREQGHEVAYLSTRHPENVVDRGAFIPLTVTHSGREAVGLGRSTEIAAKALWNPTAARAMNALLRTFKPDVIHAHKLYPQLSVAPILTAARQGVPIVQTAHDYEFVSASIRDHSGSRLDRDEARLSYRSLNTALFQIKCHLHAPRITRWISISRYVAARYEAIRGIPTSLLANFARPFAAAPIDLDEREGVLFIGRLSPEKGIDDVIALARAAPDLHVSIAGSGPMDADVAQAASELPSLDYLGSLSSEEVGVQLTRAKAILVPSRWEEPGGLVALEAMATGTPIVAYRSGGLTEYIEDGDAGIVVDANPRALLAGTRQIQDRDRWLHHSQAGLHAAETIYSPSAYLRSILDIYESAADHRAPLTGH